MTYDREIKYMRKQIEKARLNLIYAQSHDNTPQEQIRNLVEKINIIATILDALEIASHVRHGKWEDKMVRDWHCSECGKKVPKQVWFDGYCYDDKLNYCPNCGAKMDGKDNHHVDDR